MVEVEHTQERNDLSDPEELTSSDGINVEQVSSYSEAPSTSSGPAVSAKSLPKIGQTIQYRTSSNTNWCDGVVQSRGGKVKGKYWHYLNIAKPNSDETKPLSFRDDVLEWRSVAEESHCVFIGNHTTNSRFTEAKQNELSKWISMKCMIPAL